MRNALGENREPVMGKILIQIGSGGGFREDTGDRRDAVRGTTQKVLMRREKLRSSSWAHNAKYEEPPRTDMVSMKDPDFNVSIMVYKSDDMISESFKHGGAWDREDVKRLCNEFVRYGGHGDVLDVGANIGAYTLPLAACLKENGVDNNRIVSIEAAPWNAKLLRTSIQYNGIDNVDLYECIVDSPENAGVEGMAARKANEGMSSVSMSSQADAEVTATTIDAIAQRQPGLLKKVFAMKIDIEGHEIKAFKGATTFFKSGPCLIFIEMKSDEQNLTKFLQDMGYIVNQTNDNDRNAWCYRKDLDVCVANLKAGRLDHQ